MDDTDLSEEQYLALYRGEKFLLEESVCKCGKWILGEPRCSCGAVRPRLVKERWGFSAEKDL